MGLFTPPKQVTPPSDEACPGEGDMARGLVLQGSRKAIFHEAAGAGLLAAAARGEAACGGFTPVIPAFAPCRDPGKIMPPDVPWQGERLGVRLGAPPPSPQAPPPPLLGRQKVR